MTEYKYKIPLRNKNKEIIDYTYVSEEDFENVDKHIISKKLNEISEEDNEKYYDDIFKNMQRLEVI